MTRVVWWNIDKFSSSIFNPEEKNYRGNFTNQIAQLFNKTQPDIFIVIEVVDQQAKKMDGKFLPFNCSAANGLKRLLTEINKVSKYPWSLVPPIVTGANGKEEAIAVFYNFTNLKFTGPWFTDFSSGTADTTAESPGVGYQKKYKDLDWIKYLYTPDKAFGGQWAFKLGSRSGGYPTASDRTPWLTTFKEKGGQQRNLEIVSMHSPPKKEEARDAILEVFKTPRLIDATPDNTVRAIGGDFNLAIYPGNVSNPNAVEPVISALGFDCLFSAPVEDKKNIAFANTTLISTGYFTGELTGNSYPDYRYTGSACDQIFVMPKGTAEKQRIINSIVGSDYVYGGKYESQTKNAFGYCVENEPKTLADTKNWTTPCDMESSIDAIKNATYPTGRYTDKNAYFLIWENFVHIRTVSDHMAVVVDL